MSEQVLSSSTIVGKTWLRLFLGKGPRTLESKQECIIAAIVQQEATITPR